MSGRGIGPPASRGINSSGASAASIKKPSLSSSSPACGTVADRMRGRRMHKKNLPKKPSSNRSGPMPLSTAAPPPPTALAQRQQPVVLVAGGGGGGNPPVKQAYASTRDPSSPDSGSGSFVTSPSSPVLADPPLPFRPAEDISTSSHFQSRPRSSTGMLPPAPPPVTLSLKPSKGYSDFVWLSFCFLGIVMSFVAYGLMMEYATSGGRRLHELSFLFVTSAFYTLAGATGRYVRGEKPSDMPPFHFGVLGLTSMGSTFFSVRSLRYVIYPIQVLAKSCKPIPVMLMGAAMGKKYPLRKYFNVVLIVFGVVMFMQGGENKKKSIPTDESSPLTMGTQMVGISCLFVSLCFDGGTGAYEDKLMSKHEVRPFDLMYNIQLGKTILAGIGLIVFNQVHIFMQMVQDMGILLVGLGLTGAMGQIFIFVTIAKFGALTCSIIGLSRKILTLVASIYFYGHSLNAVQAAGLCVCVGAMIYDSCGKAGKKKGGHGGHKEHGGKGEGGQAEPNKNEDANDSSALLKGSEQEDGDVELADSRNIGVITAGCRA